MFSSTPEPGSDQPRKKPSRKPRRGDNVGNGTTVEEGATAPEQREPGRDEGPAREEPQALPPQWDKALAEGTGLEDSLCNDVSGVNAGEQQSGGAATATAGTNSGVSANLVREEQSSEACAGAGGALDSGEFGEDNGQDAISNDGSESTVPSATPTTDGMESIHRWLQVRRNVACGVSTEAVERPPKRCRQCGRHGMLNPLGIARPT